MVINKLFYAGHSTHIFYIPGIFCDVWVITFFVRELVEK